MWYAGRQESCIQVLVGNLKERDHLEDLGLDGRILLKIDLQEVEGEAWTELIWRALVNAVLNLQVP